LSNYNLQNPNIQFRFFFVIVTFTKKALQIFCTTNECDSDYKEWCFFTKMDDYQKLCDIDKNVIKMGVIIKGIYCGSNIYLNVILMENILDFH